MNTMFRRQFVLITVLLLLCMLFTGVAYRFWMLDTVETENQRTLYHDAKAAAAFARAYNTTGELESNWDFRMGLSFVSSVSDAEALICDPDGVVRLCSCEQFLCEHIGKTVDAALLRQIDASGSVVGSAGSGEALSELYSDSRSLAGVPIISASAGQTIGYVIVSAPTTQLDAFMRRSSTLFLATAALAIVIALAAASLLSRTQVRPLAQVAEAARQFGHGDFETRVSVPPSSPEEILELATAFNTMAESIQRAEQRRDAAGRDGRNRVIPRVGAQRAEHAGIDIAQRAVMQLHHPAAARILCAEEEKKRGFVFFALFNRNTRAGERLFEDRVRLFLRAGAEGHIIKAVIRRFAAMRVKMIEARTHHTDQVCEAFDLPARRCCQCADIRDKALFVDIDRFIRSKSRHDLHIEGFVRCNGVMIFQRIRRIVRGADDAHAGIRHHIACAERFQPFAADIPDFLCVFRIQYQIAVKVALELEMRPVVNRVPGCARERLGKALKLLAVGRVAGNEALRHAARAHDAPLIMVAAEHDLCDIFKARIIGDRPRAQMAMVINNGHFCRPVMIKYSGSIVFQQKIFVHECFHLASSSLCKCLRTSIQCIFLFVKHNPLFLKCSINIHLFQKIIL